MGTQLSRPNEGWTKPIFTVILCAGEGVRLQELTRNAPKPLIKINALHNKSILHYTIDLLISLRVNKIAIVKGYLAKKIDEFIARLKRDEAELNSILHVVDAKGDYKLGPLYSFLSITKNEQLYHTGYIYLIIPGDTIFQYNLLNEIFSILEDNLSVIQKKPLIFFRKIQGKSLESQNQSKKISLAYVESHKMQFFLKKIKQVNLSTISKSQTINQIIPIFIFPYNFIQKILQIENKISVKTIREIINYLLNQGTKISVIEVDSKYKFYDIDDKFDLLELETLEENKVGK